jgi:hypothetical protein
MTTRKNKRYFSRERRSRARTARFCADRRWDARHPRWATMWRLMYRRFVRPPSPLPLTDREAEIVMLIDEGLPTAQLPSASLAR